MSLTKQDLKLIEELFDRKFGSRLTKIEDRLSKVDSRLTGIEDRLTNIDTRLSNVEDRLSNVESRLTNVENRLSNVEDRLSTVEERLSRVEVTLAEVREVAYYSIEIISKHVDPKLELLKVHSNQIEQLNRRTSTLEERVFDCLARFKAENKLME
jgi:DNA repair ATPase RecN